MKALIFRVIHILTLSFTMHEPDISKVCDERQIPISWFLLQDSREDPFTSVRSNAMWIDMDN
jgi:hypothetical protein